MDAKRFRDAYSHLQNLDERMTYKVRMKPGTSRMTTEQLEDRCRDLASYTIELKEVVNDLFEAIAGKDGESTP